MKKNKKVPKESVHQRNKRLLEGASLGHVSAPALPHAAEVFSAPSLPVESSHTETDSAWRPRLLRNDDLPEITSGTLRAAINYMAAGIREWPREVEDDLFKNHTTREIGQALREGIRRWDAGRKERG